MLGSAPGVQQTNYFEINGAGVTDIVAGVEQALDRTVRDLT